ncbi:MAG: MarR family winged helix-turn-helix transcriptional regulator [Polyangiales bacterium]
MADDGTAGPKADRGLRRRARAVRAFVFMSRLFEYECRELEVSMAQYRMLLYLRHGPRRAGELAARASITRPSLSTSIAAMEKQGLLRRTTVDDDRRGVKLELTRKGLLAIDRIEERFGEIFDDAAKDCDRGRLLDALEELTRSLNDQIEARVRPED